MEALGLVIEDLPDLDDQALLDALEDYRFLFNQLAAIGCGLSAEISRRSQGNTPDTSLARRLGHRGGIDLIRQATGVSAASVRSMEKLGALISPARALTGQLLPPKYEAVAKAFEEGEVCIDSARTVISMLESCSNAHPDDLRVAEESLVEASCGAPQEGIVGLHADDMKTLARKWAAGLDPDGSLPTEAEIMSKRGFTLGKPKNGVVSIRGKLTVDVAAILGRCMDAILTPRHTKLDESPVEHDEVCVHEAQAASVSLTPAQKRHDAFAQLLQAKAVSDDLPLLGGAPITVIMEVQSDDLEIDRGVSEIHAHDGTIENQALYLARLAMCNGVTETHFKDRFGAVVGLSTKGRSFTGNQRRAIIARDKGCVIPGCTVPSSWCEVHHVKEWAQGGKTHVYNGVLTCWFHHRYLHANGWQITMKNGIPSVRPPKGTPWTPRLYAPPPKNAPPPDIMARNY